ncbi:unnamed protein product [Globisporangium polare]
MIGALKSLCLLAAAALLVLHVQSRQLKLTPRLDAAFGSEAYVLLRSQQGRDAVTFKRKMDACKAKYEDDMVLARKNRDKYEKRNYIQQLDDLAQAQKACITDVLAGAGL